MNEIEEIENKLKFVAVSPRELVGFYADFFKVDFLISEVKRLQKENERLRISLSSAQRDLSMNISPAFREETICKLQMIHDAHIRAGDSKLRFGEKEAADD